ncbi:hypothetical protein BDE02_16G103200 [Populus trichocarpa]|nr:hypothetical protein BDE02_16G103200 [Populus trichocarpa]
MPSAQLNFLIPCKWELQVCQLSRVWQAYWLHEDWKIYDRFSSEVSLIILHNAYWRWKLSLRISSSSWMGNTSNKSEAPSGNLRRSNGSCLILKHQLAIGLSFPWLLSRAPSSCAWRVVYPQEKT